MPKINPARLIFEKINRTSRASAILAEPSCAVETNYTLRPNQRLSTMKKVVLYDQCFEKFTDCRSAILNFFRNISKKPSYNLL
jgi:hypothetical protein